MKYTPYIEESTTAAIPAGPCPQCGYTLYVGLIHSCPTGVKTGTLRQRSER